MMKRLAIVVFLLLVLPSLCFAYGYKSISCACPEPYNVMRGVIQLDNTGGMNIFYFAGSGGDQVTQNLYSNVVKQVRVPVYCDSSGHYSVDVSSNYNSNFALSCLPTEYAEPLQHYSVDTIQGLVGLVSAGLVFMAILYGMRP